MAAFDLTERIQQVLPEFEPGAKLLRTWQLVGGISSHMTAFEFERTDGFRAKRIARQPSNYNFSLDANAAVTEYRTIQEAGRAGIPVAQTYFVQEATTDNTVPMFVIEFIEGAPELAPQNPELYVMKFAEMLARIHMVDLTHYDFSHLLPADQEPNPRRATTNEKLHESAIREVIESWKGDTESNRTVLRHGDLWPGNVLWRNDEIVGVIDWEETCIGEPIADLAICRLDILWILGWDAMEAFTRRYQSLLALDYSSLPYWDLVTALRPIYNIDIWASAFPSLGRPDVTEESMSAAHHLFVKDALRRSEAKY